MASAPILKDRLAARIALVERHIGLENSHDLEGVLATFGDVARYDDEPWSEHYEGHDGVRDFYTQLMSALPDLEIAVQRQHVSDQAIVVEVMIRGTHLGGWRGLPATGRRVEFPLCGVYSFDAQDRLAGEKILLRPRHGSEATRRVSRTAKRARTNHNSGDPSRHHRACVGAKDSAQVASESRPSGAWTGHPHPYILGRIRLGIVFRRAPERAHQSEFRTYTLVTTFTGYFRHSQV